MNLVEEAHMFLESLKSSWRPRSSVRADCTQTLEETRKSMLQIPLQHVRPESHYNMKRNVTTNKGITTNQLLSTHNKLCGSVGEWVTNDEDDFDLDLLLIKHPLIGDCDDDRIPLCHRVILSDKQRTDRSSSRLVSLAFSLTEKKKPKQADFSNLPRLVMRHSDSSLNSTRNAATNNKTPASSVRQTQSAYRISNSLYPYRRRNDPTSDDSYIPCKNYNSLHKHKTFTDKQVCDAQAKFDKASSISYLRPVSAITHQVNQSEPASRTETPDSQSHNITTGVPTSLPSSLPNINTDQLDTTPLSRKNNSEKKGGDSKLKMKARADNSPVGENMDPHENSETQSAKEPQILTERSYGCWKIAEQEAAQSELGMGSEVTKMSPPCSREVSATTRRIEDIIPNLSTMQQYVEDRFAFSNNGANGKMKQTQLIESILLYQHRKSSPQNISPDKQKIPVFARSPTVLTAPDIRRTTAQILKHHHITPQSSFPVYQTDSMRDGLLKSHTMITSLPRVQTSQQVNRGRPKIPKRPYKTSTSATIKFQQTTSQSAIPRVGIYWKLHK